jgi:RNA polymerase sigma-70 factor (ECF subfamily)
MIAVMPARDAFQEQRSRLFSLAYRMLGSAVDAEDIMQEAWLRFRGVDPALLGSEAAWLTKVVTNLCLDQLKSARARREQYVGPWLPEPVSSDVLPDVESISMAFLVLLEKLTPAERAAYLLHDVFEYSHAEVGVLLETSAAHCRQLALRARAHLADGRPRFAPSRERHAQLLTEFLAAVQQGELESLKRLLSEEVVLRSDGGGKASAATRPVVGSVRVAKFFIGLAQKAHRYPTLEFRIASVNGWPSLLAFDRAELSWVLSMESDGERIHSIFTVLNPDKLGFALVTALPFDTTPQNAGQR